MELILLAREIAVFAAAGVGAYTDYKTGYINDWNTLPLIIFGITANLFQLEWMGLLLGAAVFALGYAMYYTGKIGGGDVKLYTGIALALPFYNGTVFILSAALLAAMSAVVFFGAYYCVKYYRKGIDLEYNAQGIRRAVMLLALLAVYFVLVLNSGIVSVHYFYILAVPLLFGVVFVALEKGIRKEFFLQKIKISEMEEDEIVAIDFMHGKEVEKMFGKILGVFGEKEKMRLEKIGVKEIMVYRNLPRFGPFIFIGAALALLIPEIVLIITGGF